MGEHGPTICFPYSGMTEGEMSSSPSPPPHMLQVGELAFGPWALGMSDPKTDDSYKGLLWQAGWGAMIAVS